MRHSFVAASAQAGRSPQRFIDGAPCREVAPDPRVPHGLAVIGRSVLGILRRIERILAEWPCEQMPDAGELMLAGLGSPVFSPSCYAGNRAPDEAADDHECARAAPAARLSARNCAAASPKAEPIWPAAGPLI